ncbi:3,4-dihydroxy-2-butanone-4-phosphate synthase [Sinorhizobium fredii]|uniref:3,4-dihydroxy-2-butanone-4-phosphate synthase n=1 Tax=Rhizobium fredii TaxID=380 RepID=UPI00069493B7|nr:3,4-dihydroxy-2-butanone-4-phosphate synthase [Sinorhizobium fredii]WOS64895.1 3,4-dihydroxy-2-butanone-4-phosphate synthase [Sinorhizobium fredii GR64]
MISKIEDAIAAVARGEMVVVVDDEDRENEGDVVVATQAVTPEAIAFMMKHARGLICVAMEGERLDALDIPLMVPDNTEFQKTAFTVSVDYFHGTTTGISAADRAATVLALIDEKSRPADFARPGHIFPLRANPRGVLARPGHTEAAVELARLAGLAPSGVICEVANDDGTMARLPELERFAQHHALRLITIKDLIAYVRRQESASELEPADIRSVA